MSMYDEKGAQRRTNVAGVLYAHAELSDCGEHALELEIENFPLPGSLRLIGVERDLTSLGVERGRLPHLYKTGKDTCAIFHLLLHGVSRLNYAGLGDDSYAQFPDWTMAE